MRPPRPITVLELARRMRGLSQSDLGKNSKVQQTDISQMERRLLIATDQQYDRLWAALGIERGSTPRSFLLEVVPENLVPRLLSDIRRGDSSVSLETNTVQ